MSATQSAHYIVDESGQLHDGNTWGMGNTDRGIPNRWRVKHGFVPTFRGVTRWKVLAPGAVLPVARFRTWREAMAYADRMARTREVVLPRPNFEDEVAERTALGPMQYRKVKGWSFPEHQVALMYEPESDVALYYLVDDTTKQQRALGLRREEWVDVATALLALAEQEEA